MAIHSVSEVNHFIKGMLDAEGSLQRIMVRGEISNFKTYRSGHCYFTLKDADTALKCVMFRSRAQYLSFVPQDGQQVVASGSISVWTGTAGACATATAGASRGGRTLC